MPAAYAIGGKTPMLDPVGKPHRRLRACHATLEHLIPRHAGGADTEENTVAACHQCNSERGAAFTPPLSAHYAPKFGDAPAEPE